ncbi:class I SAM-dependent methyltransferase [Nocardioides zhouii]|uniref:Class I SAM-dependent methyltransferase n=1 Tax=Nocardioides zhouii TaxID=1168729 RepID=A0A4Q2TBK1_9ACTN|nr:class I SAM-dependent methyltransferase [Nocardioides zhouii]RYC14554.1 class I SAM-dependent methyltransferase [Nocardioides zhouii]
MSWDKETLLARIDDAARRIRHEAGSPCPPEIAAYARALPDGRRESAVVLGMTPELRTLALSRFERVVSIDMSPEAVAAFGEWPEGREREEIVQADWRDLPRYARGVDAVLTDGGFPNSSDVDGMGELLTCVRDVLRPGGRLVTRHPVVPEGLDLDAESHPRLVARYREGSLDPAEFGFGMRLLGHLRCCWDGKHLDNVRLFAEIDSDQALTDAERVLISRYVFNGRNVLLSAGEWERLLVGRGYEFAVEVLTGRDWYRYYPVYSATPAGSGTG